MRLHKFIRLVSGAAPLASGSTAGAKIVYSIESGIVSQIVDPLAGNQTADTYYDYPFEAASGNPDFGPEDDAAFFWLYTDTNTGVFSLRVVFDKRNADGIPFGGSNMKITTSGMSGGAFISVEDDDDGIVGALVSGAKCRGRNAFNTDGAMRSGLEGTARIIHLLFNSFSGTEGGFFFLTGPDPVNPTKVPLDIDTESALRIIARDVPEPGTLPVLSLGLLALGARLRAR